MIQLKQRHEASGGADGGTGPTPLRFLAVNIFFLINMTLEISYSRYGALDVFEAYV